MARPSQVTSVILIAAGLGLMGLMAYALMLDSDWAIGLHGPAPVSEIAVYYPETSSWRSVQAAVRAGVEGRRFVLEHSSSNGMVLRLPHTGRRLALTWHNCGGATETRADLTAALQSPTPPKIVVGSSNTALTLTLARTLREQSKGTQTAGLLLIPDATAVSVWKPAAADAQSPRPAGLLLDEYPGRSFRICLNNARLAQLLVNFECELRHVRPSVIELVDDPADPYSVDFSNSLVTELRPLGVTINRQSLHGHALGQESEALDADEARWSDQIAQQARNASPNAPVWVVLALQGDPARRRIFALGRSLPPELAGNLRVLCGDGLGLQSLQQLAGRLEFAVACASSLTPSWNAGVASGDDAGAQLHYEWLTILANALDSHDEPSDLAARLVALREPESGQRVFDGGERAAASLGSVMEALPLSGRVRAFAAHESPAWQAYVWAGNTWRPTTLEAELDMNAALRSP
jgi:hypothetical protein